MRWRLRGLTQLVERPLVAVALDLIVLHRLVEVPTLDVRDLVRQQVTRERQGVFEKQPSIDRKIPDYLRHQGI